MVIGQVDADRMLPEMVRVTKPAGRVAVVERAMDRPLWINIPLGAELKARSESTQLGSVAERGCADASLYRRFGEVGLVNVKMFPQAVAYQGEKRLQQFQERILSALSVAEVRGCLKSLAYCSG